MNLYMFAEHDEIEEIAEGLVAEISPWTEPKTTIQFIHRDEMIDLPTKSKRDTEIGIELSVAKTQKLKEPLNFLYQVARNHKCEFVVGLIENDIYQDVCFFGFEEGRPDMFEIAHYLGLEK